MRRIEIPLSAVEKHEDLLGKVILQFLDRLAKGQRVSWTVRENNETGKRSRKRRNAREKILSLVGSVKCVEYWKWILTQCGDFDLCRKLGDAESR